MPNELLPCPFCAGKAEQPDPRLPHGGMVQCTSCGASAFGPKWNRRSATMSAGTVAQEAVAVKASEGLDDCFRHHIVTTIGWPAFATRPSREMQMYEEGFKAGYRRSQSDNEPEFGEGEDWFSERTQRVVAKLRESLRAHEVDPLAIDNAVDLLIEQSKALEKRECQYASDVGMPEHHCAVRCVYEEKGYASAIEHAARIAERYDDTDTLTAPKAIAAAIRSALASPQASEPAPQVVGDMVAITEDMVFAAFEAFELTGHFTTLHATRKALEAALASSQEKK